MTYERLLQEHDRIDHHLARLSNIVDREDADAVGATLVLSDLSEELRVHLAHEDSLMYRPIITAKERDFTNAADQFCAEFAELREDWDSYLVEWTTGMIESDWAGFRETTRSVIDRLTTRVRA